MQKEMLNNVEEFMHATFRYSLELPKQYSQYYCRSKAICWGKSMYHAYVLNFIRIDLFWISLY